VKGAPKDEAARLRLSFVDLCEFANIAIFASKKSTLETPHTKITTERRCPQDWQ
jgi:hypothetical protein